MVDRTLMPQHYIIERKEGDEIQWWAYSYGPGWRTPGVGLAQFYAIELPLEIQRIQRTHPLQTFTVKPVQ